MRMASSTYDQFQPRSEGARIRAEQEIDRLQFLSWLGLARRVDERSWQLAQNHERDLRERQVSKDVIKSRSLRQRTIDSDMDRVREREEGAQWLNSVPIGFPDFQSDARLARAKRLAMLSLAERSSQSTR